MLKDFANIYTVGDRETVDLFRGEVTITEKIDGSFFGFGLDDNEKLAFRSRGTTIQPNTEGGIFGKTVQALIKREEIIRKLSENNPGIIFFGEAVSKPKHNKLVYETCPEGNIVLWGGRINNNLIEYAVLQGIARELQLPITQKIDVKLLTVENLKAVIQDTPSMLGGKMEGVVIRSHDYTDIHYGLPIHAKLVGAAFREKMNDSVKSKKPKLEEIFKSFDDVAKEARWQKAIQHLAEENRLSGSLGDIGPLMGELAKDFKNDSNDDVKELLYKIFAPDIIKHIQNGFAQWYKDELTKDM